MPHKDPKDRKEWQFKRNLKRRYNISLEEYERRLTEQGGKCAICGKDSKLYKHVQHHNLGVDHNHETGTIRGLLCVHCNRNIIGSIEKIGLEKVINYIKNGFTL